MDWPPWALDKLDRRIHQEELNRLWDDQEPDAPTQRGREEDRTFADPREQGDNLTETAT